MIEVDEWGVAVAPPGPPIATLRSLLIGAGEAGRAMARALRQAPDYGLLPVGFLDDNLTRRQVAGLPVLGHIADIAEVTRATGADVAVVTIPSLPPTASLPSPASPRPRA